MHILSVNIKYLNDKHQETGGNDIVFTLNLVLTVYFVIKPDRVVESSLGIANSHVEIIWHHDGAQSCHHSHDCNIIVAIEIVSI